MDIGVPREIAPGERRVALIPETVEKLVRSSVGVIVESGAGAGAFHHDDAYRAAGATVLEDPRAVWERADLIIKVQRPRVHPVLQVEEVELPREGAALVCLLQPLTNVPMVQRLAERRITAFSMDAVPRIARAQALDVLSSMSSVSGYRAIMLAATALPRFFPLLMTAAGTVTPARVLILGAGVAGLQAIATARRLGAVVEAFDTRPAVKEQVQSLGATFVEAVLDQGKTEDRGGYATELSEEAHRRELELIGGRVRDSDVVVTTALVPGRRAPILITAEMVGTMRAGSVIVDLAGEFGGNCELSRPGEVVVAENVTIIAPLDLPSGLAVHASQMYSRNVAAFLQLLIRDGAVQLDFEDQIIREMCITHSGEITHPGVRAHAGTGSGA